MDNAETSQCPSQLGQGHLAYRAGACARSLLADLSSDPCQDPVEESKHPTMFSFLFVHSLSFCFMSFKVTESLQRGTSDSSAKGMQQRTQHRLGPNTKYNPLSLLGNVLHTLKTGDLAETLTHPTTFPVSTEERKGLAK